MQKRRIVALALAAVMAVGMLAGCGQKDNQDGTTQSTTAGTTASTTKASEAGTTEATTEKVEELEPYTVTWWIYGEGGQDVDAVDKAFNEKLAELLPNTTVEFVRVAASEYKDRWNKALAAGEKIDIGWSASWVNPVANDVNMGVVTDIEDLLYTYGQGIVEAIGGEDVVDMHRSADGNVYFIPCWQGLGSNRSAIYIRQDVADLMPEGWMEEAQEIAFSNTEFTAESKKKLFDKLEEIFEVAEANGVLDNGAIGVPHRWGITNNGVCYNDYTITVVETEPGVFSVYKWYGSEVHHLEFETSFKWQQEGWVVETAGVEKDWEDGTYIFREEQALDKNWLAIEEASHGLDVDGFLIQENLILNPGWATGTVFPNTGENPERAMMVANLIYSNAELYQLLIYGIEGTHYTTNTDGTITVPENKTYTGPSNWTVGTCANSLATDPAKLTQYTDAYELEQTAVANPLAGFSFDTTNLQTEAANLKAVRAEYNTVAADENGNWINRYNEAIAKLEQAGIDTYLEEFVDQLTEFVEARGLGKVVVVENPVWE
ncbi:MAG: ABC transporter substrate-binding protein [Lachnospiraceae bacterium]|nr:ABC transporter substrate-binding protein [Lachnospiraceae bacterium]